MRIGYALTADVLAQDTQAEETLDAFRQRRRATAATAGVDAGLPYSASAAEARARAASSLCIL